MNEKFKVNFNSHIRSASSILFLLLVGIGFVYVMSVKKEGTIGLDVLIWIAVGIFILLCGPAIIIHLNYYKINRGYTLSYDSNEREITIGHRGQCDTFNIDDIEHVERFMSYNLAANRSGIASWDEYNHSVIYLNNGEKFIITSLLVPNLNLPIPEEKIRINKSLFRLAKLS